MKIIKKNLYSKWDKRKIRNDPLNVVFDFSVQFNVKLKANLHKLKSKNFHYKKRSKEFEDRPCMLCVNILRT